MSEVKMLRTGCAKNNPKGQKAVRIVSIGLLLIGLLLFFFNSLLFEQFQLKS